jgi:hypothetical protein
MHLEFRRIVRISTFSQTTAILLLRNILGSSAVSVGCDFFPYLRRLPAPRQAHYTQSSSRVSASNFGALAAKMSSESQATNPRIISSQFLDSSDTKDNLAIVVLNWKLPLVTPLLLEKGKQ